MSRSFHMTCEDESAPCQCCNCSWEGKAGDLEAISDFSSRVAPGETCPAGECPECGALVHLKVAADAIKPAPGQFAYKYDAETGDICTDCEVGALVATINFEGCDKSQADMDAQRFAAERDAALAKVVTMREALEPMFFDLGDYDSDEERIAEFLRVRRIAREALIGAARIATNACDILADECKAEGNLRFEAIWRKKAEIARAAIAKARS